MTGRFVSGDVVRLTDVGTCDLIIRAGQIFDGTGGDPIEGDVAVDNERIVATGDLGGLKGREELQAAGRAVTPGFINVLSWATESILEDGRYESDVRQGVTLDVFSEGESMGPLPDALRDELRERQQGIYYDIEWTTVGEYLEHLEARGIVANVASFVGATTVRANVIGHDDRSPSADELERMRTLVRQAMLEGALGVGASLIDAPACYAATEELVELARVAAEADGLFISHLRSEADRLLEAVDELIQIAEEAGVRAEIYHLKAAGRSNWDKLDEVIDRVERARAREDSPLLPTCTRTRLLPPVSTRACHPGFRKAASPHGENACATPRFATELSARCCPPMEAGRTSSAPPAQNICAW